MILTSWAIVNVLFLLVTVLKLRNLHLYELIFIWVIASFLHMNIYYVITSNLDLWGKTEQVNEFFIVNLTRMIGYPFLIMWFLSFFWKYSNAIVRMMITVIFMSLLVGVDYFFKFAKITRFEDWAVWQSSAVWAAVLGFCLLLSKWYRMVLRKEGFI
jgi:hypothetical protein